MKDIIKYAIVFILGIVFLWILRPYSKSEYKDMASKVHGLMVENIRLKAHMDSTYKHFDSVIQISNNKLDSLENVKLKTVRSYEIHIKNLRDVTIVSDDSITRYISDRIYDR